MKCGEIWNMLRATTEWLNGAMQRWLLTGRLFYIKVKPGV
jgi:hypothetical protein